MRRRRGATGRFLTQQVKRCAGRNRALLVGPSPAVGRSCGGRLRAPIADDRRTLVTSVQRFGGSVNVHLHFHTLVLEGVFVREADGTLRFHPAVPPTDDDVHRVVARVRRRLERLGLTGATSADEDADLLAEESAALASLSRAAILGRAALDARAGRRAVRVGADPTRRGSSATCRSTHRMAASTSMRPCTSPRATASGWSGSASTSAARRSGRDACAGCATGGSPSSSSARGRTGRPISSSRRWNSWSGVPEHADFTTHRLLTGSPWALYAPREAGRWGRGSDFGRWLCELSPGYRGYRSYRRALTATRGVARLVGLPRLRAAGG